MFRKVCESLLIGHFFQSQSWLTFCFASMCYDDPRRTARGYRKASHGFRAALLESTSEPGLRSISGALSSQEKFSGPADGKKVRSSGRCPAQFALAERFAYLTESQGQFKDCDVLGLVADGVHVGDEDWLNCFLYHGEKDIVTVCPPQAGAQQNHPTSPLPFFDLAISANHRPQKRAPSTLLSPLPSCHTRFPASKNLPQAPGTLPPGIPA